MTMMYDRTTDFLVELTAKISMRESISSERLMKRVRDRLEMEDFSESLSSRTVVPHRSAGESLLTVNRAVTGKKTHRDQFFRSRPSGSMYSVVRRVPLSDLRRLMASMEAGLIMGMENVVSLESWTRTMMPRGEE
jgi:hypothetical protein